MSFVHSSSSAFSRNKSLPNTTSQLNKLSAASKIRGQKTFWDFARRRGRNRLKNVDLCPCPHTLFLTVQTMRF